MDDRVEFDVVCSTWQAVGPAAYEEAAMQAAAPAVGAITAATARKEAARRDFEQRFVGTYDGHSHTHTFR